MLTNKKKISLLFANFGALLKYETFIKTKIRCLLPLLRDIHFIGEKHVMRYLKGTLDYGLRYASSGEIKLHGYLDSDWGGSAKYRKSTSGCCFSLGLGMISWFNRKQTSVALRTAEAKNIATCSACSEAVWLRKMLEGLFDA